MHETPVLPNFLRQREQKIGGLLTQVQMFVAVAGILPVVVAVKISGWLLIPVLLVMAVLVFGLSPAEGGYLIQKWIMPLRARFFGQTIKNWRAFADLGDPPTTQAPLVWHQRGKVSLAARVEITQGGKKKR